MFLMTAQVACDVYDAFLMAEALSEEERIKVLMPFVESGKVEMLNSIGSKEDVVKALSEHFKVLRIEKKRRASNDPL
jgi:uncharacterized protein (DUF4213/DUF364 family)